MMKKYGGDFAAVEEMTHLVKENCEEKSSKFGAGEGGASNGKEGHSESSTGSLLSAALDS
jgi:hypothetical protein